MFSSKFQIPNSKFRTFSIRLVVTLFIFSFLGAVYAPTSALAQCDDANDPLGVDCGSASGLANTDVRFTVARIINAALGLLGVIMIVLMVYSGFLWMTSAGSEDKVEHARGIIYGAVIGLVIILSAYTVTYFVLQQLYSATTESRTYSP